MKKIEVGPGIWKVESEAYYIKITWRMKEITRDDVLKWYEMPTYRGINCLKCGQQYLTQTKESFSYELRGPRCPTCSSSAYSEPIHGEVFHCKEGYCQLQPTQVVSEEKFLKTRKIQKEYSDVSELVKNSE